MNRAHPPDPPPEAIRPHPLGVFIAWTLSLFWSFAALLKLFDLIGSLASNPGRWLNGSPDPEPETWSGRFPALLLLFIALVEIAAAWTIGIGRATRGVLIGSGLLAIFLAAIVIWPIPPGSGCGCMGPTLAMPGTPVARLALLGGLHALALALVAPCGHPAVSLDITP